MNLINVVAPVYNEEKVIVEFVRQVVISLESFTEDYKIILVDDGSSDESWSEIVKVCRANMKVSGIKLSKNFGHHYAITAGINSSDSEWVVVMDTDLQDQPEYIPQLFKKASEGYDVVFVSRVSRPEAKWYKLTQKIFYILLNFMSGMNFDSTKANFSIINKKVVLGFNRFNEQSRFYASTVNWLGFKSATIKAKHGTRFYGKPSYTLVKRFKLAKDVIFAFSDRILTFSSIFSVLVLFITFPFFLVIVTNSSTRGNLSDELLLTTIYVLVGTLILISSTIALYLRQVLKEVKARPLYLVEDEIN